MRDDLAAAVETLEGALARAAPLSTPGDIETVRRLIDDIRLRRGFLGRTLVVAIAGGTGTGKSSLLNALAGSEISPVGAIRPTTDYAVAWVPPEPTRELTSLLDMLGVDRRIAQPSPSFLAIIDLPDLDSVISDHRDVVEDLVSRVDVVVWVADPEKYNDRVLHRDFIDVFRRYQDQFLFVLNQIDLVSDPVDVADDWAARLVEDGAIQPNIIRTAADPISGDPVGIDVFRDALGSHLDAKRASAAKIAGDLLRAADLLAEATGVGPGGTLEFEERWAAARDEAAHSLARGGVTQATHLIAAFVGSLATDAGPDLGFRIREQFSPERIRRACETASLRMPTEAPQRRRSPSTRLLLGWAGVLGAAAALFLNAGMLLAAALSVLALVVGVTAGKARSLSTRRHAQEQAVDSLGQALQIGRQVLDAEFGIPLREVVRPRGELAALLTQVGLEAALIEGAYLIPFPEPRQSEHRVRASKSAPTSDQSAHRPPEGLPRAQPR